MNPYTDSNELSLDASTMAEKMMALRATELSTRFQPRVTRSVSPRNWCQYSSELFVRLMKVQSWNIRCTINIVTAIAMMVSSDHDRVRVRSNGERIYTVPNTRMALCKSVKRNHSFGVVGFIIVGTRIPDG